MGLLALAYMDLKTTIITAKNISIKCSRKSSSLLDLREVFFTSKWFFPGDEHFSFSLFMLCQLRKHHPQYLKFSEYLVLMFCVLCTCRLLLCTCGLL